MSDGAATMFLVMLVAALPEVIPRPPAWVTPELRVVVFSTASLLLFGARAARSTAEPGSTFGALALVPAAFLIVERGVDPIIVPDVDAALPLGLAVWLVTGAAATSSPLWLPALAKPLLAFRRVVGRRLGVVVVAALIACLGGTAWSCLRTPAPGIHAWRAARERLTGSAHMNPQLSRVLAGSTRVEELAVPDRIEAATLVRGVGATAGIEVPTAHGTAHVGGTEATLDGRTCRMPSVGLAVLVVTGDELLVQDALLTGTPLAPCSLLSDVAVPLSRLGLPGDIGAPAEVAHLLAAGLLVGLALFVGSRWLRARARWVSGLEEARIAASSKTGPPTARLASGELVRLTGGGAPPDHRVLLALPPLAEGYRDDARASTSKWIATSEPRHALVARLERHAAAMESLAFLAAVWLSLPAMAATWHGFALSVW